MAKLVDAVIVEAVHAVTCIIDFNVEVIAKDRLRLQARVKGGGIRSMMDMRRPVFLDAILYILPRCIDSKAPTGELTKEIYNK